MELAHGQACLEQRPGLSSCWGTHHAFPEFGSGFCIFNDLAVCARVLIEQEGLQRLLVVDLDVHQGDGTAWIFSGDERVFTFSAHAASNFPSRKQVSDLDLSLSDGLEDGLTCKRSETTFPNFWIVYVPQLVLYNAGVDPHQMTDWDDSL